MISRLRPLSVGGTIVALLVVGACSASSADFQSAAEDVIEGDIAEQSTLGDLSATCEEPDDPEPGDVFACTATTEDGRTIEFTATVEDDDQVNVQSTNLITVEGLGTIEEVAVAALEAEIGETLGVENFDCGAEPVDHRSPGRDLDVRADRSRQRRRLRRRSRPSRASTTSAP